MSPLARLGVIGAVGVALAHPATGSLPPDREAANVADYLEGYLAWRGENDEATCRPEPQWTGEFTCELGRYEGTQLVVRVTPG
jgi:hypothetical protein